MRKIKGYGVGDRAVIGRLKRLGGVSVSACEIALFDRVTEASDIFALPDDVSGMVAVGECTDSLCVAVRARGISAVFISQEDADAMKDGERVVIYPERDTVFIAPKIEIVDDFSTRMRAEIEDDETGRDRLLDCRELFSGKVGAMIMKADATVSGEERAFEMYKSAAKACELQKLVIILPIADFGSADALHTHLRGMIRAAVYTKLVVAVLAQRIREYERAVGIIKCISGELRELGVEIPESISCGTVIESAAAAVCAKEYSSAADVAVIECERLLTQVSGEERALVLSEYLDVIFGRISGSVREIALVGDKTLIEKCSRRISATLSGQQRSYFLIENKNIK